MQPGRLPHNRPALASASASTLQIGKDVRGGVRPPLPADPSRLPGGTFPGMQGYLELMQACWAQRPQDRPAFGEVVERLRDLRALATDG